MVITVNIELKSQRIVYYIIFNILYIYGLCEILLFGRLEIFGRLEMINAPTQPVYNLNKWLHSENCEMENCVLLEVF